MKKLLLLFCLIIGSLAQAQETKKVIIDADTGNEVDDLLNFVLQRWYNHLDGGIRSRVIWDLALIQAIIFPEYAEKVPVETPRAKGNRQVWYYKDIQANKMREEFFNTTLEYVEGLKE